MGKGSKGRRLRGDAWTADERAAIVARIRSKVTLTADGHWLAPRRGTMTAGYARIWVADPLPPSGKPRRGRDGRKKGREHGLHRISWAMANPHSVVPQHRVVRHRCSERRCCNPAHLQPGTPAENAADIVTRRQLDDLAESVASATGRLPSYLLPIDGAGRVDIDDVLADDLPVDLDDDVPF